MNAMVDFPLDAVPRSGVAQNRSAFRGERPTECGRMDDPIWVVAATEYQEEPQAAAECRAKGFQVFNPLVRILVPQSNRPAIRQTVPAFPGYLFVLTTPSGWHQLKRTKHIAGVLSVVGDRDTPAIMPQDAMSTLLARASIQGVLERHLDPELPAWCVSDRQPKARKAAWTGLHEMSASERVGELYKALGFE